MFAAEYGHLDVIEVLIERGADLETKDQVSCYSNLYNMLFCDAPNCVVLFYDICATIGRNVLLHDQSCVLYIPLASYLLLSLHAKCATLTKI